MQIKQLNYPRYHNALASAKLIGTPPPIHNHRHKLLNLVPEPFTIKAVEELLVLRLILVPDLEEIGQPPGSRDIDVAPSTGDDQIAFGLDANAQGNGRGGVGVVDDRLGEDIHAVLHPGVKVDICVIAAEEFDDGEQGQRRMLVHGAAGLGRIELTGGRRDHLGKGGLHVHDIADDAALDHRDQMGESRAESGLAGFQEDEAFLVGKAVKLFGFLCTKDKRNLAEYMLAGLEGALGIVVMSQVGRGDIDGIDLLDEGAEIVEGLEAELMGKGVSLSLVGIEDGDDIGPAHDLGFRDEPTGDPAGTDDPDLADILRLFAKLRAGDSLGARKIDHLAVLVQIVELPHPVGPDGKDIHIILLDIINLLPHIVLDDHLIGIPGRLHGLNALKDIVTDV